MSTKRTPATPKKNKARRRTCRVLLVEASPAQRTALEGCGTAHRPMSVVHAPTLTEARKYLADHSVDLAVIAPQLPDGSGFDLTAELSRMSHTTAKIVLGGSADFAKAQPAIRAGADDYVVEGISPEELKTRAAAALDRKTDATLDEIKYELSGNLCRCGTYPRIRAAVRSAAEKMRASET